MTNIRMPLSMWLISLLLVVGSMLLSACTAPMPAALGNTVTREFEFSDFDKIEVSDAFAVQIRQGDEYRVTVEIDQESLERLEVNVSGDTLHLSLRPRPFTFFRFLNWVHRAEITMPTLTGVTVSDASRVEVSGFRTDAEARFEVSDASSLDGEIDTGDTHINADDASRINLEGNRGDVEVEANDSSNITLVGEGRNATVRAGNASRINMENFSVQDANVEAHDASHVTVDVSGRLDAEADDASSITYYGDPTIGNTRSSDASSINARER